MKLNARCEPASPPSRRCTACGSVHGRALEARVGIATGPVVVGELIGEGAAREETVVGETPNLAARLQTLAEPGAVVIAARTRQLIGGLFELKELGRQSLKGFPVPVWAWRVIGEGAAESWFEALHGAGLTPLVGREHEIGLLLEHWERAKDGEGQVVLLAGEPGIGKSRLLRTLRGRLESEALLTVLSLLLLASSSATSRFIRWSAFWERAAGFRRRRSRLCETLDKLEALLCPFHRRRERGRTVARGVVVDRDECPLSATGHRGHHRQKGANASRCSSINSLGLAARSARFGPV